MRMSGRRSAPRHAGAAAGVRVEALERRSMLAVGGGADIPGARFIELGIGGNTALSASVTAPDGKIVVCGYPRAAPFSTVARDVFVARLNPDGTFDPSFGPDGRGYVYQDVYFSRSDEVAAAVMVQADGRIVVAGGWRAGGTAAAMAMRFNADGTLDTSFGNLDDPNDPLRLRRGVALVRWQSGDPGGDPGGDHRSIAHAIAPGPGGTIYLAGEAGPRGSQTFAVARLTPNGQLDTTFGPPRPVPPGPSMPPGTVAPAGWSTVDFTPRPDYATAVQVLPDGRLLLSGPASAPGRGGRPGREISGVGLAVVDATGLPSAGFGNGPAHGLPAGTSFLPTRRVGSAVGAAIQPDGKLVTTGMEVQEIKLVGLTPESMRLVPSRVAYLVSRFNADGTPDGGFGRRGATRVATDAIGTGTDVMIDPAGNVVVAGLTAPHWRMADNNRYGNAVVRLDPTGKADRTFGSGRNGVVSLPFAAAVDDSPDSAGGPAPERVLLERTADASTLVLSGANGQLRVAVLPPAPPAGADLVVAPPAIHSFRFTRSDPNVILAVPGGMPEKRARVKVTNTGAAAAAGTVRVRLLASKDPTADATDVVLAEAPAALRLGPRKSKVVSLSFTWPVLPGQDTYFVLAHVVADGLAEIEPANNSAAGLVTIVLGGPARW